MTTLSRLPTTDAYAEMQLAYDHFNRMLFAGQLPPCLITFQRKEAKVSGYFSHNRFGLIDGTGTTDEIALNPIHFRSRGLIEAMQTLVHEMCHLWQAHFGKPTRGRYHNAEWAVKMDAVGLTPSHNGEPGGKRTGQRMADYPTPGGPFLRACADLQASGFKVSYYDRVVELLKAAQEGTASGPDGEADGGEGGGGGAAQTATKKGQRVKFACPGCKSAAWGKPSLDLTCNPCNERMVSAGAANA
jgi:hypothetical protein